MDDRGAQIRRMKMRGPHVAIVGGVLLLAPAVFAQRAETAVGAQGGALAPRSDVQTEGVPAAGAVAEEPRANFTATVQSGTVQSKARPCWPELPWSHAQRSLALLATLGSYSGFGLGVRAGSARFGFDGSYGFLPVLVTFQQQPESDPLFKFMSAGALSAGVYFGVHRIDPRTDLGFTFGYKYSTLLGHGATAAFYVNRELATHWAVQLFIGPTFFPDAEDRIRRETGWKHGSVSSGLAFHQGGGGLSISFFP
jgi:hypothetical protein